MEFILGGNILLALRLREVLMRKWWIEIETTEAKFCRMSSPLAEMLNMIWKRCLVAGLQSCKKSRFSTRLYYGWRCQSGSSFSSMLIVISLSCNDVCRDLRFLQFWKQLQFPMALRLPLINTHIGSCFQTDAERLRISSSEFSATSSPLKAQALPRPELLPDLPGVAHIHLPLRPSPPTQSQTLWLLRSTFMTRRWHPEIYHADFGELGGRVQVWGSSICDNSFFDLISFVARSRTQEELV